MSENIGCAIIHKNQWFREHEKGCRDRVTSALGVPLNQVGTSTLTYGDFGKANQIAIVSISETIELWVGWLVTQLMSGTDNKESYPNYWKALFLAYDTGTMSFEHQYFNQGVIGSGGNISGLTLKVNHRYFRYRSIANRTPEEFDYATDKISEKLGTTPELVKRVKTGMMGKGRYGLAYHPEKKNWVMAKQEDDLESFIELNPNSYKKKGKVFGRAEHESSYSFLSQIDMFNEYYQHAIESHIGTRFDALEDSHFIFNQPAIIYSI